MDDIGSELLTPTLIRAARALLGYDQATLAVKTGISKKTIGLIETMEFRAHRRETPPRARSIENEDGGRTQGRVHIRERRQRRRSKDPED